MVSYTRQTGLLLLYAAFSNDEYTYILYMYCYGGSVKLRRVPVQTRLLLPSAQIRPHTALMSLWHQWHQSKLNTDLRAKTITLLVITEDTQFKYDYYGPYGLIPCKQRVI